MSDRDPRTDPLPGDVLQGQNDDPATVTGRAGAWVAFRRGGSTPVAELAWWVNAFRSARVVHLADRGDAYEVPAATSAEEARRLLT